MALTFGLTSLNDLYAKLKRDASALEHEVTSDHFFNFVVTGYSMIDWVKNDPYVPYTAKSSDILQGLYNDQWLKVCGDLATACKHYTLSKRKPITLSAIASSGFGVGGFGKILCRQIFFPFRYYRGSAEFPAGLNLFRNNRHR